MGAVPDVFSPAQLGPITLRNKILKAVTFEARTPGALVSDDLIAFHRAMAAGGVGMTTLACCAVSPGGRTDSSALWMRPEAVTGLSRLAEAVHAEGAALSAQIGHAGPVANARSNKAVALAPVRFFNPLSMRFARRNAFKPPLRWGIQMSGTKYLREYPYRDTFLLRDAERFRRELTMPLILLGGITDRDSMDRAMAAGFDFVAMGRALLAEPDLINRIRADAAVRSVCNHCNKCMPTIYSRTRCVVTGPI